jgi:hypothetical protein
MIASMVPRRASARPNFFRHQVGIKPEGGHLRSQPLPVVLIGRLLRRDQDQPRFAGAFDGKAFLGPVEYG